VLRACLRGCCVCSRAEDTGASFTELSRREMLTHVDCHLPFPWCSVHVAGCRAVQAEAYRSLRAAWAQSSCCDCSTNSRTPACCCLTLNNVCNRCLYVFTAIPWAPSVHLQVVNFRGNVQTSLHAAVSHPTNCAMSVDTCSLAFLWPLLLICRWSTSAATCRQACMLLSHTQQTVQCLLTRVHWHSFGPFCSSAGGQLPRQRADKPACCCLTPNKLCNVC
jgi:hypothetical protein